MQRLKARKKYSNIFFIGSDINDFEKHYDVIISSHTLEHFENPFELFSKMIKLSDKYFVLIIPFQEKNLRIGHYYTFDYNFFPISFQDYELVHYKEIDRMFCESGGYWVKEQILVVYANTKNLDMGNFSLAQLNNKYFYKLKQQKKVYEDKFYALNNETEYYQKKAECLQNKFYGLNKQKEYYQKKAKCLEEKQSNVNKLKVLEKNASHTKKQLMIIANTKPYRLAYALRRFSHEFLNGNITEKKNFLKWIYCKLTRKKCGLEYRYNPIIRLVKK